MPLLGKGFFPQLILSKMSGIGNKSQSCSQNLSFLEQQKELALPVIISYATTQKGHMVCIGHFSSHPLCYSVKYFFLFNG